MFSHAGLQTFWKTAKRCYESIQCRHTFVCLMSLLLLCSATFAQSLKLNFTEYPAPNSVSEITGGPDGAIWFTESFAHSIGRITPTGNLTEISLQSICAPAFGGCPEGITSGPDGALWFAYVNPQGIGRITTSGQITNFPTPTNNLVPLEIVTGSDHALWFTSNSGVIGRLTTSGSLTQYNMPAPCNSTPFGGITSGPDGAIWFIDKCSHSVGRITTAGVITEYPDANLANAIGNITAGSDGALWFSDGNQSIGRITTSGVLTVYPAGRNTLAITNGPDGAIWFTTDTNLLGRIGLDGAVTTYSTPTYLSGIILGPDGALWAVESNGFCGAACFYKFLKIQVPARTGVLSQVAAGGGWETVISLINTSQTALPVTLNFHADNGSALNLSLAVTQQGATQTSSGSSVSAVVPPNGTVFIDTGTQPASTVEGWAEVVSSASVAGYAIFRQTPQTGPASEGTVPLQTQFPSTMTLAFDNTSGFVMGVAIGNLSAATANITATIWDDSGNQLGTQNLAIAANGHTAFVLPTQIPSTTGKRGIIHFQSSGAGGIAGLGLRFSPFGTFTSVPTVAP